MRRHRTVGAFVLTALLAGLGTGTANAETPWQWLRREHAKHVAWIEREHARHVRAIERLDHRIWSAHERHMRYAPEPVRRVDRFVAERHRAHMRFLGRTDERVHRDVATVDHMAQRDVTAVDLTVHGNPRAAAREHQANVRTFEERHAEHAQAVASVGASADRDHGHRNPLQRLADWLVGA